MKSLIILNDWIYDKDANIRRFAIESTRPQGVWAKQIGKPIINITKFILTNVVGNSVDYGDVEKNKWF